MNFDFDFADLIKILIMLADLAIKLKNQKKDSKEENDKTKQDEKSKSS